MRNAWIPLVLLAVSCASEPIKKPDLAALVAADAKVMEGCYDCLIEARSTYERVGVGQARPMVIARIFETQLLIGLRERELALDSTASFARARELAKELPPAAEADRFLALAEMVAPDSTGTPHAEVNPLRMAMQPKVPALNQELAWLKTAPTLREPARQYLSLSVDCGHIARPGRPGPMFGSMGDHWTGSMRPREAAPDAPPLVAYRVAACDTPSAKGLDLVRAAVPQFPETAFFLARLEVGDATRTGAPQARPLLAEAYKRFPKSPSVTQLSGTYHQLAGDCREALRYYDETIALKPRHETALLGRVMCLSHLGQPEEAITTATRMIELKTDNIAEAYYWRAWNQRALQKLDLARTDIEEAKRIDPGGAKTFTLAGMIEHDQPMFDDAERDLTMSRRLDPRSCVSMWYMGLVKMRREQWLDGARQFEDAMNCYAQDIIDDERNLAEMKARTQIDPDFRARQIANFQSVLEKDRTQHYAAAFNAATFYAQSGNIPKAKIYVEVAAKDPALADKVAKLKELLK